MSHQRMRLSCDWLPGAPTNSDEMEAIKRRGWIEQGTGTVKPEEEIHDEMLRKIFTDYFNKRYGKRGVR